MKVILYLVAIFFTMNFIVGCQQNKILDQDGKAVNLTQHPGKWLVINYWAPWCASCKHELPELNQFYLTHRGQVDVYGFDYDHLTSAQLIELKKNMGIDFPLLVSDPAAQLNLPEITGLPTSFVYNPQGVLVHILTGPQKQEDFHVG